MGVIDHDDMLSNELIFVREGFSSLIFHIPWPDQSPLYFLYLRGIRTIGESPLTIHLVNGVLLSATLGVTYFLALALTESRAVATGAVLLGTLSPASLWLVRYGRMYSLQILFAVLAAWLLTRYLQERRQRDLIAFALVSLLSIYTHFLGFVVTALLFVPLVFEGTAALVAGAWVVVLSVPQIVRLAELGSRGVPLRGGVSLPALSSRFLDRVTWFWFVNSDWGPLRAGGGWIPTLYLGSIVVLACVGFAAMRRRVGVHAAMWILLPLAAIGVAAAWMDVRDRYFVWALPVIWIAIAAGGFGPLPAATWLTGARADAARGIRAALVLVVIAGSLWLLWQKLPERGPESAKLMAAVARVYRPSMKVYMPPSSALGMPRLIALHDELPAGLRDVRPLSAETRPQFLREVEAGNEFVFLLFLTPQNEEMRWRAQMLQERGYQKAAIPVFGASAQFFTLQPLDGWSTLYRLEPNPPSDAIVSWARARLSNRAAALPPSLADAVVARVGEDGAARLGRLFTSQHGEWGAWRLGPAEWDGVEEARVSNGGVARRVVSARPLAGSVLVVAFPAMAMKQSVEVTCTMTDAAARPTATADVGLYVNGEHKTDGWCSSAGGWRTLRAETSALSGRDADVVLLITAAADLPSRVAFDVTTSSRADAAGADADGKTAPIVLTGGRRLSDDVESLRVSRLTRGTSIAGSPDGRTLAAAEMHEAAGPAGEGMVHRVWALGALPWDAVGSIRQTSNGETRKGIWAHPRNGTVLVIEASSVQVGETLHGFAGFTDYSLQQAHAIHVSQAVTFTLALDGRTVLTREISRTAGWSDLTFPAAAAGTPRLRIQITAPLDSWAHFVFDLWSE